MGRIQGNTAGIFTSFQVFDVEDVLRQAASRRYVLEAIIQIDVEGGIIGVRKEAAPCCVTFGSTLPGILSQFDWHKSYKTSGLQRLGSTLF